MDTFDEIKTAIGRLKYTELLAVADSAGLHVNTLYHIRTGRTWRPSFATVMQLKEHLIKAGHLPSESTGVSD